MHIGTIFGRVARRSFFALAATLAAGLTAVSIASADTVQTVRIVPDSRLADGTLGALLDRELPSSEAFDLEVSASNARLVGAVIELWPRADWQCGPGSDSKKLAGARQYHRLAMLPSGTGDERVLRARVPALQVNKEFCVRLTWQARLDGRDIQRFARSFGEAFVSRLESAQRPVNDRVISALALDSQIEALRTIGIDANPSSSAAALLIVRQALASWLEADSQLDAALRAFATTSAGQDRARADVARLKGTELPGAWVFDTSTKVVVEADLATAPLGATEIEAIIKTLAAARSEYKVAEQAPITKRIAALEALGSAQDDAAQLKARAELAAAPAFPPAKSLYVPTSSGRVPSKQFADQPESTLGTVLPMLRRVAESPKVDTTLQQAVREWLALLDPLEKSAAAYSDALAKVDAAKTAKTAAHEAMIAEAATALTTDDRVLPTLQISPTVVSSRPGKGVTPAVGNYVTPAVGVVGAFPVMNSKGRLWVFPYFGLSLYAQPIDRHIPVGDLVGQFWQRTSIVAAISLKDVSLPNADAEPVILDGFPYVGIGYRITEFMQANIGAAIYRYRDVNPASDALQWGIAPGLGVAIDLDVLAIATQGMSGL